MSTDGGAARLGGSADSPSTAGPGQSGGTLAWTREPAGKAVRAGGAALLTLLVGFVGGRWTSHDHLVSSIRDDREVAHSEYITGFAGWIDAHDSAVIRTSNQRLTPVQDELVSARRSALDAAQVKIDVVGSNTMVCAADCAQEIVVAADADNKSVEAFVDPALDVSEVVVAPACWTKKSSTGSIGKSWATQTTEPPLWVR